MIRKRRRSNSNAPNNSSLKVFIPVELITEILSLLSVKAIVRFKCVSKSWKTLTSDSNFIDKHLKVSSQNSHLTFSWSESKSNIKNVVPFPVHRLFKKQSITVSSKNFHSLEKMKIPFRLVGSCNGLLCFVSYSWKFQGPFECCLHFSNPATRTERSEKFQFTFDRHNYKLSFGYDASTRTYKVVGFRAVKNNNPIEVNVFNLGDSRWRNIENFPLVPGDRLNNIGVHFNGTINWLVPDKSEKFVIVSLDLSTERYKQFLLPRGFDEVPVCKLVLTILMDCFCFSHNSNKTEFVLWKMKEYGVRESWTQLFKISYRNLAMQLQMQLQIQIRFAVDSFNYQLVCLYVNGDIVIFASKCCKQSFIYNLRDKTVVKIKSRHTIEWSSYSKDYVESLVSVH